jgi:low affinity Fe/Cu permease
MMIVVAFVALIMTVIIQGVLLRRVAIAQRKSTTTVQQSAAVDQRLADLMRDIQQRTQGARAEFARAVAKAEKEPRSSIEEEMAISSERTRGGFNRSIRKLDPPSDGSEQQRHEHD